MTHTVFTADTQLQQRIMTHYQAHAISPMQHAKFTAQLPHCKIIVYNSGKVMLQGKGHQQEAQLWQTTVDNAVHETTHHQYNQMAHIGSDEAGSGDYFGPLTAAAVFIKPQQISWLKELGVNDSKKITDIKIKELAPLLMQTLPYSLMILDNPKYNTLEQQQWTQGKMKVMLHYHTIQNVIKKINGNYEGILIDQFSVESSFNKHLRSENLTPHPKTYFETKAESKSLAVACASIISRYAFIEKIQQLSTQYKMEIKKGAGHQVDIEAAKFVKRYGINELDQITKKHFANRQKVLKLLK